MKKKKTSETSDKKKKGSKRKGWRISEGNRFALILCAIVFVWGIFATIHYNKLLSGNTETVSAKIVNIYLKNYGRGLWCPQMRYRFYLNNKEYFGSNDLTSDEYKRMQAGDSVEIVVSLKDPKIQRWNKARGTF